MSINVFLTLLRIEWYKYYNEYDFHTKEWTWEDQDLGRIKRKN